MSYSSKLNKYKLPNTQEMRMGYWVEIIDSNQILIVRYRNGKKEGKARILYTSGEYETLSYKNDLIDGVLKHYYPDGFLCWEMDYKNGEIITTKNYCDFKLF